MTIFIWLEEETIWGSCPWQIFYAGEWILSKMVTGSVKQVNKEYNLTNLDRHNLILYITPPAFYFKKKVKMQSEAFKN